MCAPNPYRSKLSALAANHGWLSSIELVEDAITRYDEGIASMNETDADGDELFSQLVVLLNGYKSHIGTRLPVSPPILKHPPNIRPATQPSLPRTPLTT